MCFERFEAKRRDLLEQWISFSCVRFMRRIKRKARVLSAKKKIARNHREGTLASVFLLLLSCACVTPIDATAAGMNLKQFNFYSTRRVNCLLVEKRQPGLGSQTPPKKKRKREKKRRERRIFCDTSAHEQKCSFARRRIVVQKKKRDKVLRERERKLFYSFTTQKRGKGRQKRARVSVSFSF